MQAVTRLFFLSCSFVLFSLWSTATWSQPAPSITLEMTLVADTNGMTGDECGTQAALTVGAGTDVEVCYTVTNTSQTTFELHDLVDSEFGSILFSFAFTLAPGASVWLTETVSASADTTFSGTWTAYTAGPSNVAADTDSATLQIQLAAQNVVPVPALSPYTLALLAGLLVLLAGFHLRQKKYLGSE